MTKARILALTLSFIFSMVVACGDGSSDASREPKDAATSEDASTSKPDLSLDVGDPLRDTGRDSANSEGSTPDGSTPGPCALSCTDIVRQVDFETNDFSQVPPGDTVGDSTIVTEQAHCGSRSARLTAPPKADIRMWSLASQDYWLSYWIYLPTSWNGDGRWQMLHEWCPGVSPFCDIHVLLGFQDKSGIENNIDLYYILGAGQTGQIFSDVSLPQGEWVHIKSYTHWNETDGNLIVWMNDREILNFSGRTTMLPTNTSKISLEIGSYRDSSYAPSPMYVDDIVLCRSAM
jgi:hypothetical protein